MNRLAGGLLALVVALVSLPASGQSMADAAAKERERRERQRKAAGQKPKVFTNDDLSKGEAASSGTPDAGAAPPAASGSQRSSAPSAPEARGPDEGMQRPEQHESVWRAEAAATRKAIEDAEARVKQAEQQLEEISGRIRLSTDTNEILRLADQKQAADRAVADARASVEAARAGLAELEERARRAGVPPGWIR